jgi:hypothetical protein
MITKLTTPIRKKDLIFICDTYPEQLNEFLSEYPFLFVHRQLTCAQDKFKATFDFWKKKSLKQRGKRGKDKKKRDNEGYLNNKNSLKIKEKRQ